MDLGRLAEMIDTAQKAKGISDYRLEHDIGVMPDGKVFNATQLARLKKGERIKPIPRAAVERMIDILGFNADEADEAWEAAGLLPPDVTAEHLRLLRQLDDADDEQAVRAVRTHRRHQSARRGAGAKSMPNQATTQGKAQSRWTMVLAGQRPAVRRVFPADAWRMPRRWAA